MVFDKTAAICPNFLVIERWDKIPSKKSQTLENHTKKSSIIVWNLIRPPKSSKHLKTGRNVWFSNGPTIQKPESKIIIWMSGIRIPLYLVFQANSKFWQHLIPKFVANCQNIWGLESSGLESNSISEWGQSWKVGHHEFFGLKILTKHAWRHWCHQLRGHS